MDLDRVEADVSVNNLSAMHVANDLQKLSNDGQHHDFEFQDCRGGARPSQLPRRLLGG